MLLVVLDFSIPKRSLPFAILRMECLNTLLIKTFNMTVGLSMRNSEFRSKFYWQNYIPKCTHNLKISFQNETVGCEKMF